MTTPWAHLPNAVHIDRVIAHAKEHPRKWVAVRVPAWSADWRVARGVAWDAARGVAWDAAWDAARGAARGVGWDAILALIAWDDAGELLSLPIEQVKAMADEGNHAAVLLYPAMLAMLAMKEQNGE